LQKKSDSPSKQPEPTTIAQEQKKKNRFRSKLQEGNWPTDNAEEVASDILLNSLNCKDFPAL